MLILASASAARRRLLRRAGVRFRVAPAAVRELSGRGRTLRATVLENARRKAASVPGDCVLAADTLIEFKGRIYGKPRSRKAAVELLGRLAGKTHVIATGVVLRAGARRLERYVESRVTIRPLKREAIERLTAQQDSTRFAGGYALRGHDPLIARVDGSVTNVIGLPMEAVLALLRGINRRPRTLKGERRQSRGATRKKE